MIGKLAAEAINNEPVEIHIGGDKYLVPRPTLRTMMAVSKHIECLPEINLESENLTAEMLSYSKYNNTIAKIFAVLILGEKPKYNVLSRLRLVALIVKIERKYTIGELFIAYSELTTQVMQIQSFFALTTSLRAVSLTRSKEVDKTIAHGQ